jgi:hypothetical protein
VSLRLHDALQLVELAEDGSVVQTVSEPLDASRPCPRIVASARWLGSTGDGGSPAVTRERTMSQRPGSNSDTLFPVRSVTISAF